MGKVKQENTVFFAEAKFNASMKGIIDIQGRLTENFSLVIAMEPRNPNYDGDFTRYSSYLALHVSKELAHFSIKRNGLQVNLTDMTDMVEGRTFNNFIVVAIIVFFVRNERFTWVGARRDHNLLAEL